MISQKHRFIVKATVIASVYFAWLAGVGWFGLRYWPSRLNAWMQGNAAGTWLLDAGIPRSLGLPTMLVLLVAPFSMLAIPAFLPRRWFAAMIRWLEH